MVRYPSVKTIESRIGGIDHEDAVKVRRLLDGRDDPMEYASVQKLVAQCYNEPSTLDKILCAVDEILGTCGTEAINADDAWDHYWQDVVAVYCNNGQSYDATILYDVERGSFYVTSWADWVETAERNRRYSFR